MKKIEIESLSFREKIKRKYPYVDSNKLKRYLNSNVGRKWDDIYSDICHKINRETFLGNLSLSTIKEKLVKFNVIIEDNKVFYFSWGKLVELRHLDLYVCPEEKILKQYFKQKKKRKYNSEEIEYVSFHNDPERWLEKHNEIWFLLDQNKLKLIEKKTYSHKEYGTILGQDNVFFIENYEVFDKIQLNSKEIKSLKDVLKEAEEVTIPKRIDSQKHIRLRDISLIIKDKNRRLK